MIDDDDVFPTTDIDLWNINDVPQLRCMQNLEGEFPHDMIIYPKLRVIVRPLLHQTTIFGKVI